MDLHRQLFEGLIRDQGQIDCAIRPYELDLLVGIYKAAKPARSIEWGLGSGVSAVALGKARQTLGLPGRHVALDPFQKTGAVWPDGLGLRCMAAFSAEDAVDFQPVTSEEYLIGARARGDLFDFVFIDGAHDVGQKLMDACLANKVLATNGIICFHDSFFTSTALAVTFLVKECGMELMETGAESSWKRRLRGIKHASRLGLSYALEYAPQIDFSLSVLKKK